MIESTVTDLGDGVIQRHESKSGRAWYVIGSTIYDDADQALGAVSALYLESLAVLRHLVDIAESMDDPGIVSSPFDEALSFLMMAQRCGVDPGV